TLARQCTTTSYPSLASASAIARPMPRLDPVTRTVAFIAAHRPPSSLAPRGGGPHRAKLREHIEPPARLGHERIVRVPRVAREDRADPPADRRVVPVAEENRLQPSVVPRIDEFAEAIDP